MKEVFESFQGMFFIILLMVSSVSVLSGGIDANNANATKTGYIAEIENSNFSASVLGGILADAEADGYGLSVDLYHQNASGGRTITEGVTSASGIPDTSDVYMARLDMSFDYKLAMFNTVVPHEMVGYAR